MKRLMIQRNRMIKERKYCGDNICHSIILGNTIFIFIVEKKYLQYIHRFTKRYSKSEKQNGREISLSERQLVKNGFCLHLTHIKSVFL